MQIVDREIEKTLGIFKILELAPKDVDVQVEKLKNALLMDMAAEALAEKGQISDEVSFEKDEVEDFLLDNYDSKELAEIVKRVSADVVIEYLMKIIKDVPAEKKEKINEILREKF